MVTVEQVESRAELAEALAFLCEDAQKERRRGISGVLGRRYADLHDDINHLLTSYEKAPH